jgi:hypothetical protein
MRLFPQGGLLVKRNLSCLAVLSLCSAFALPLHAADPEALSLGAVNILAAADSGGCLEGEAQMEALPDGAEGFAIPSNFLVVRPDDLCRVYDVPLELGVKYRSITVDFDLDLDRWVTPNFHNITSLRRSGKKRNERILYYGVILKGDNRRTVLDLGKDTLKKEFGPWQEETRYHLTLTVNVGAKRVELNVYQGDDLVHSVAGKLTTKEIVSLANNVVRVDFSSIGIADHAYFPPTGWRFSNLIVAATR